MGFILPLRLDMLFEDLFLQYSNLTVGLNGPVPYHFPFFKAKFEKQKR